MDKLDRQVLRHKDRQRNHGAVAVKRQEIPQQ
jgi:ribosome-associated translation inhibitor RaiA